MSRELWSQAGEPTWAIDERLRRLEARVNQLAAVVAELVSQEAARDRAASPDPVEHTPDPESLPALEVVPALELVPALAETVPTGPGVTDPVGSSGRAARAGQPCRPEPAGSDGGSRGGA